MQAYSAGFLKQASTALVRAIRSGKLSPGGVVRAGRGLPEGYLRQIRPMGTGSFNLADLMVGNLGVPRGRGLVVRTLPTRAAEGTLAETQGPGHKLLEELFYKERAKAKAEGWLSENYAPLFAKPLSVGPKGRFTEYVGPEVAGGGGLSRLGHLRQRARAMQQRSDDMYSWLQTEARIMSGEPGLTDVAARNMSSGGRLFDVQVDPTRSRVYRPPGYGTTPFVEAGSGWDLPVINKILGGLGWRTPSQKEWLRQQAKIPPSGSIAPPATDYDAVRRYWLGGGREQLLNSRARHATKAIPTPPVAAAPQAGGGWMSELRKKLFPPKQRPAASASGPTKAEPLYA